jgi:hypothetical protein
MAEINPREFTAEQAKALPRFGGLTTGEDRMIGDALADAPDMPKALAELCDLIGTTEGMTLLEARRIATGDIADLGDRGQELCSKYTAEIKGYNKVSREYGYQLMDATVTAFMRYRSGHDDWEERHTQRMMRDAFLAVWTVAQDEINAEATPVVEPTEESMGKPLPAKAASKRTGRRISGN